MMKTNITQGKEAVEGLMRGVEIACNAVKGTMGGAGMNVVIEADLPPFNILTNDGATIIESIQLTDPLERRGLAFVKEVVARSNENSGDGSTTTTVLLNAILQEGYKSEASGLEIKNSLDELLPVIEKAIDGQKREITVDNVKDVATIAGESEELGQLIQDIYTHIGKDGIIDWEGSGTYNTTVDYFDGVRFRDAGYLSPYMVHDEEAIKDGRQETRAVYENPTILVTKQKIAHINDINPLLKTLEQENKKDLIIFTDDMDSGVASLLIDAHKSKVVNVLIIKAPVLWKNYIFEDFAKCVGATIIEDASGLTMKTLKMEHLGTCEKIITDKGETVIMGTADISQHKAELKKEGSNDSLLRLSWLTTKTAVLKLGANSETELSYKRLKAEDAINASKSALEDGIVVGGGVALFNASLSWKQGLGGTIGGKILTSALQASINQIATNAGKEAGKITASIRLPDNTRGLDTKTGQIVDMWHAGIVDSAKVVKMAVRNAIGIASTILTANAVITTPPITKEQLAIMSAQGRSPTQF